MLNWCIRDEFAVQQLPCFQRRHWGGGRPTECENHRTGANRKIFARITPSNETPATMGHWQPRDQYRIGSEVNALRPIAGRLPAEATGAHLAVEIWDYPDNGFCGLAQARGDLCAVIKSNNL